MIQFRVMTHADVSEVAALEKMCFHDPWSEKSIEGELHNPLSCWIVACEGERVVGYVGSQTVPDETDMMNIAVHPDFRRRSIAQQLIAVLIEQLRLRASRSLMLEVRASNEGAKALYRKMGFCEVGVRKNYYRNPKEDALILRREWEK